MHSPVKPCCFRELKRQTVASSMADQSKKRRRSARLSAALADSLPSTTDTVSVADDAHLLLRLQVTSTKCSPLHQHQLFWHHLGW